MINVTEKRGSIFSVTLSDNSTLTLQAGETAQIKNELVSESLKNAEYLGIVSLKEVVNKPINPNKKESNKKTEVQVNNG